MNTVCLTDKSVMHALAQVSLMATGGIADAWVG
jgi:hypothetical protein